MKNKDNIQPAINPKPMTIQRLVNTNAEGKTEVLLIKNVAVDPRETINQ